MLVSASEEVTTVRKPDLSAELDWNLFESLESLLEDIHHADFICKANYDMETRRMESERVCLVLENLTDFESTSVIVPDAHSLVSSASSNQLLLYANVHAVDGTGMDQWDAQC